MSSDTAGAQRCTHEIWEMDTAAHADALCPLCLVARLRAVEAERDAEKREVDRLNGHLQAYQGKLVKAQADAQRLTAELDEARRVIASWTKSTGDANLKVERLTAEVERLQDAYEASLRATHRAEDRERALVEALTELRRQMTYPDLPSAFAITMRRLIDNALDTHTQK